MLEQSTWVLEPWTCDAASSDAPAQVANICDAAGKRLGFVRLHDPSKSSWLSWLGRVRLDVFETDDASHLMTLRRAWGVLGSWDIEDADQRHVGTIYSKTVVTATSDRLGYIDRGEGRILDAAGKVLARLATTSAACQIHLAAGVSANPFVRMLVFGSALTMLPLPGS
jgi:hypothetical protein